MADTPAVQHELSFFLEITDSFKASAASSASGQSSDMQVAPFLDAMTMFLRIFDAFNNKIFTEVVKKDVQGNIDKLRAAAAATGGLTLNEVIDRELADPKYAKLIKDETGKGQSAGTVALLWMKRTMQFVCGLLKLMVADKDMSLANASRASYADTLKACHNFITKNLFNGGLGFAPSREAFYKNLTGAAGNVDKVDAAMADFLDVFQPQLDGIVAYYKERGLETLIKT